MQIPAEDLLHRSRMRLYTAHDVIPQHGLRATELFGECIRAALIFAASQSRYGGEEGAQLAGRIAEKCSCVFMPALIEAAGTEQDDLYFLDDLFLAQGIALVQQVCRLLIQVLHGAIQVFYPLQALCHQ